MDNLKDKKSKKECNRGVCCDVADCIHNLDGCDCEVDKIKVTNKGPVGKNHFCRTYTCNKK
jgi:hypothetical protein